MYSFGFRKNPEWSTSIKLCGAYPKLAHLYIRAQWRHVIRQPKEKWRHFTVVGARRARRSTSNANILDSLMSNIDNSYKTIAHRDGQWWGRNCHRYKADQSSRDDSAVTDIVPVMMPSVERRCCSLFALTSVKWTRVRCDRDTHTHREWLQD